MVYPASYETFTVKRAKQDKAKAADMNAVQAIAERLQTTLGLNPQGSAATVVARLDVCLDSDGTIRGGTSYPGSPAAKQLFFRTDTNTLAIRNAANSAWLTFGGASNTLFQKQGQVEFAGSNQGEYVGTSLVPADPTTGNYHFSILRASGGGYQAVWKVKWTKIANVSTITWRAQSWTKNATGSAQAAVKLDVGGQNSSASGTSGQTTPEWVTNTIDVSSLTTGTTYDVTLSLTNVSGAGNDMVYLATMIAFGS